MVGVLSSAFAYQAFTRFYDDASGAAARVGSTGITVGPAAPAPVDDDAPVLLLNLGYLLLVLGGLCAFWLAVLTGWPILFFSGSSFLLLIGAVLPPCATCPAAMAWARSVCSSVSGCSLCSAATMS